ncbi:cytochrome P450 [Nocardioides ferulae]|uniref:cytochrome P450 n=1 Tax=Nocardioides ferulae TaxID=2340821 RepID=UPI000EAEF076|nr:cytochrome P450 [Nocardioides ferulae]
MTDLAIRLKTQGFRAVETDRQARRGGDSYESRLLGRRAVVLGGEAGARLFYDERLVSRAGAIPPPLGWLLFGRGALHALDDEAHRRRKLPLLDVLAPGPTAPLVGAVATRLEQAVPAWGRREVRLFPELANIYGTAALGWAGIECPAREATHWSLELARIVDGFGFAGSAYPRAWLARRRFERWAAGLVDRTRAGELTPPEGSALAVLAGGDLDRHTAAVELGNLLRPTVAVAWLGTFAALALDEQPQWRERLTAPDGDRDRLAFAHEVRRTTPFAPALAGRARAAARHEGVAVRAGDQLILDVRGINTDPRLWNAPERFRPERFLDLEPGAFAMVPQGGGHPSGHRCPGEPLTLRLLAETLRVLAATDYTVASARAVDLSRIPTLPPEGLRLTGVRQRVPAQ